VATAGQAAGVEPTPAAFFNLVFGRMQVMVDALIEDAAAKYGSDFRKDDVRWLEATPDGSTTQHCRLIWQETVLLELHVSLLEMRSGCEVEWSRLRH